MSDAILQLALNQALAETTHEQHLRLNRVHKGMTCLASLYLNTRSKMTDKQFSKAVDKMILGCEAITKKFGMPLYEGPLDLSLD